MSTARPTTTPECDRLAGRETYLFDVQLEYAYLYMYEDKPAVDMFKASGSDGVYNGFLYFFP